MAHDPKKSELAPPRLMEDMMATLGVEPGRLATPWGEVQLSQAIRRCTHCQNTDECRGWLHNHLRDRGGHRSFCINAGLFDRYRPIRY